MISIRAENLCVALIRLCLVDIIAHEVLTPRRSIMMNSLDQDLVRAFTELQQPADRIACFGQLRQEFLEKLPSQVIRSSDHDDLVWRLLQLRKQGKLPALHRESN
jgi:hypothetical protein